MVSMPLPNVSQKNLWGEGLGEIHTRRKLCLLDVLAIGLKIQTRDIPRICKSIRRRGLVGIGGDALCL